MKVIKFVDIVTVEYTDEGEAYERVHAKNVTIPEYVNEAVITGISPYFSKKGRLFKNVSLITAEGAQFKVVGNYEELNKLKNRTEPIKGYYGKG